MVLNYTIFMLGAFVFIVGSVISIFILKSEMKYERIPYPKDRNPALIGKLLVMGTVSMIVGVAVMGVGALL